MSRLLRIATWPLRWPGLIVTLVASIIAVNVALVLAASHLNEGEPAPSLGESEVDR